MKYLSIRKIKKIHILIDILRLPHTKKKDFFYLTLRKVFFV
jgi:hypothetical protein